MRHLKKSSFKASVSKENVSNTLDLRLYDFFMVNENIYADLRRQVLGWTVVLIGAGTWISLLAANLLSHRLPTEWIGVAVAIVSICAVIYTLRHNHLRMACYIAVACMWMGTAIAAFLLPQPFLCLFGTR